MTETRKKIPVLILSMHDPFLYAERALHAGAKGYIMKQEAMESVVTAIRQVLAGKIYLNEKVKYRILFNLKHANELVRYAVLWEKTGKHSTGAS